MKSREACLACQAVTVVIKPINKNVYVSPISVLKCALCLWSKLKEKKEIFPVKSLSSLGL